MKNKLEYAIHKAGIWHAGQTDLRGVPYILHPIQVMLRLIDQPEHVQVAAILHDVVEDTDVPLSTILSLFGKDVHRLVDLLTRRAGQDYAEYILKIGSDPEATEIKIADLLENTRPDRPIDDGPAMEKYRKALEVLTYTPPPVIVEETVAQ